MIATTERQRVWLGIDPGAWGAIAAVNLPWFAQTFPLWGLDDEKIFQKIRELHDGYDINFVYLEKIVPMPYHKRGPIGTHKLSRHAGALAMALTGNGIDFEEVLPVWWQNRMGCRTGGNKRITLDRAKGLFPAERFPHLKVRHEIADALLIARCCQFYGKSRNLLFRRGGAVRSKMSWRKLRI